MQTERGRRGVAVPIFNLLAGVGWVVNATLGYFTPAGREPRTHRTGGWIALGLVWTGVENRITLALTRGGGRLQKLGRDCR